MHQPFNKNNKAQHGNAYLICSVLISLSLLTACATTGDQNSKNQLDLKPYATLTTNDAVNHIESNFRDSDRKELDVYAPDHYSTAARAIDEAKKLLAESQPREKVVQKVAVAQAMLRNGDVVMRKVKDLLEDEITTKNKLDSLNTKSAYATEYGSLNERLNKIIRKIESGNTTSEDNRKKLLKDMQSLERKALYHNAMNEPREILKRVKYRGGEQLAPITYGEAIAVFKRAEEFIQQNPNYDIGIAQMGSEALFAAKRALYIAEGVSALKQKVSFSPEQVILDEEYRMHRVARQLAELDYRDNSLEVQSELLAKDAEAISLELKNKDDLVIALRDTLIKVRDSSSRLTMLSESTERLKQEKNQWLAKEALFKAKVEQLANELKQSETQLDSTQQRLLAIKSNNTKLEKDLTLSNQNASALKKEILDFKLTQKKLSTEEPIAPTNNITTTSNDQAEKPAPSRAAAKPARDAARLVEVVEAEDATNNEDTNNIVESAQTTDKVFVKNEIPSSDGAKALPIEATAPTQLTNTTPSVPVDIVATSQKEEAQLQQQTPTPSKNQIEKSAVANTDSTLSEKHNKTDPSLRHVISKTLADTESEPKTILISQKENATRAKITEQETLEALKSARELIKDLKNTETKLMGNPAPAVEIVQTESDEPFLDDGESDIISEQNSADTFVDATE